MEKTWKTPWRGPRRRLPDPTGLRALEGHLHTLPPGARGEVAEPRGHGARRGLGMDRALKSSAMLAEAMKNIQKHTKTHKNP